MEEGRREGGRDQQSRADINKFNPTNKLLASITYS